MAARGAAFFNAHHSALQQWFTNVDKDRTGRVSPTELQSALGMGGLSFSLKLVSSLVRMHDESNTGRLDFTEFCAMQAFLTKLQGAFQSSGHGAEQLNLQQVQQAERVLGFALDMQPDGAFYKMVQSYDFSGRGLIELDSFIAMAVLLENAQRLHAAFDPNKSGRATFDFNQFIWTLALL